MLQRQTQAKHELFLRYLATWARVLSHAGHRQLMVIDGFSFAGMYTSDEDGGGGGPGSPLLALQAFTGDDAPSAQGLFLFVDRVPRYIDELKANIERWPQKRPSDQIRCRSGDFAEEVLPALELLEKHAAEGDRFPFGSDRWTAKLIPAFVFVDPYGVAGFPMELLGRFMTLPRTEVFINLMWVHSAGNLHNPTVQDAGTFTRMFGSECWRDLLELGGDARRDAFLALYLERLRSPDGANARIVRSFEMCGSDGAVVYWMVFCTHHPYGWRKMKEAMWQVDPVGRFQFKDTTDPNQPVLFEPRPQVHRLRALVEREFAGVHGVSVKDVIDFVIADTPFLEKHLRKPVLIPMEDEGRLTVHSTGPRRAHTYKEEFTLDFA